MLDRNFVINLSKRDTDISEYLMTLYNLVIQGNCRIVVELGCGQSSYALCAGVNQTLGILYSVDLDKGGLTRLFPEGEGILDNELGFHFIKGNDLDVVENWKEPIDLLFVDTTHTYEQTTLEIQRWFPHVRWGGQIAMHDTAQEDEIFQGCRKALDEFLETKAGRGYSVVHLLDTKIMGMSILTNYKTSILWCNNL